MWRGTPKDSLSEDQGCGRYWHCAFLDCGRCGKPLLTFQAVSSPPNMVLSSSHSMAVRMPELSDNIYWDALCGTRSIFLIGNFRDASINHTFSEWIALTGDRHSRESDPRIVEHTFILAPQVQKRGEKEY